MRNFGIALALLLLAGSAAAQGKFEGTVVYKMTVPGGHEMNVTMAQKGNKLRQEAQGPQGQAMASIIDSQSGDMTMLMPAQKAYMTMNLKGMQEKMKEQLKAQGKEPPDPSKTKVTPTGKSETVAGIKCQGFTIEPQDGSKVEICAAKGMGFLGSMETPGMGPAGMNPLEGNPAMQKMAKEGFFPLRIVVHDPKGQTMSMVATKVDRKAPAAALFAPPADFKKMDMPGMMGPQPGMNGHPPLDAPAPPR